MGLWACVGPALGWTGLAICSGGFCGFCHRGVGWRILIGYYAPDAAGSGIPQLKVAYWRDMGKIPLRVVVVKFLAGVLSVGGGLSLGREGPTVQLAGGMASVLGGKIGLINFRRRTHHPMWCCCGPCRGAQCADCCGDICSGGDHRRPQQSIDWAYSPRLVFGSPLPVSYPGG